MCNFTPTTYTHPDNDRPSSRNVHYKKIKILLDVTAVIPNNIPNVGC